MTYLPYKTFKKHIYSIDFTNTSHPLYSTLINQIDFDPASPPNKLYYYHHNNIINIVTIEYPNNLFEFPYSFYTDTTDSLSKSLKYFYKLNNWFKAPTK